MARTGKKTTKAAADSKTARGGASKARGAKPGKEATTQKTKASQKGGLFKKLRNKVLKYGAIFILFICLIPVFLTLLYAWSPVRPISTLMIANWVQGEPVKRNWVKLEDVSPFVYQSVISSEDGKFCSHNGVDWDAVNLVVDDLIDGERPRGASTIPMQTVKNVYLWSSRSYVRKVLEIPLALLTDWAWSKRRMMEIYLNIAEWGPGIYGIEAAAQHHFKRSAKRLTRRQAALLAVTLPNPKFRNPGKPKRGLRRLARLVEKRARQSGAYVKCMREP